jgi:hypothetical protein
MTSWSEGVNGVLALQRILLTAQARNFRAWIERSLFGLASKARPVPVS